MPHAEPAAVLTNPHAVNLWQMSPDTYGARDERYVVENYLKSEPGAIIRSLGEAPSWDGKGVVQRYEVDGRFHAHALLSYASACLCQAWLD